MRFHQEAFLWAVGSVRQVHRIPFDPRLVRQGFPPPHDIESLGEALTATYTYTIVAAVSDSGSGDDAL